SKDSTVSHTLPNTLPSVGDHGSNSTNGVRNKNSAPCANNMKIAGQRDTSGSARPRQNSNAVSQVYAAMIPEASKARASTASVIIGRRQTKSQITAPVTR